MATTEYPLASYPSPPSSHYLDSRRTSIISSTMGGTNGNVSVDGIGNLDYQRAVDIARNTEGDLDPSISEYLEQALSTIWTRIENQPESYVLTKDEFAVFNFYRQRFMDSEVAERAVARYWTNTSESGASGV
ncbi:hypothetical protein MBLNU230_g6335t1 [Neophaeotheca triangularis]